MDCRAIVVPKLELQHFVFPFQLFDLLFEFSGELGGPEDIFRQDAVALFHRLKAADQFRPSSTGT